MRFPIYLPIGYVTFIHFDIVYGLAYYHCLVVVGGGLMLYMLLEETEMRGMGNWLFSAVKGLLGVSKWMSVGVFLVFYMLPNLRYLRKENHYVK